MHQNFRLLLLLLLSFLFSNCQAEEAFCLISPPKSGTHLVTKLLEMLTGKKKLAISYLNSSRASLTEELFEKEILKAQKNQEFLFGHTNPNGFAPFFKAYGLAHEETLIIMPIRDLRSLLLSFVFHKQKEIAAEMGREAPSIEEMLAFLMDPTLSHCGSALEGNIIYATGLLSLPNVVTLRFENCVGPEGGGTRWRQKTAIVKLANRLGIALSEERLLYLANNLFGNDKFDEGGHPLPRAGTFRKGSINEWKAHFKPIHKRLFKRYWSCYQSAFGYQID